MRIGAEPLSLHQLRGFTRSRERLELDPRRRGPVDRAAQAVDAIVARGEIVYGVNTGFGLLARTSVSADNLKALQRNLVLSHSAGTGPLLDDATVRLILALKITALVQGYSGVRWSVLEAMLRLVEAEVYPCVPAKGSVGASGDLAPLAHLSAALIGIGEVRHRGEILPATEGLRTSASTRSTRAFASCASVPARLIAVVVLPSPAPALVTASTAQGPVRRRCSTASRRTR